MELADEKGAGVSGYTTRSGEISSKMKTNRGYSEEQNIPSEQPLHSKTSSVMHEETSDESYLQVRYTNYYFYYREDRRN